MVGGVAHINFIEVGKKDPSRRLLFHGHVHGAFKPQGWRRASRGTTGALATSEDTKLGVFIGTRGGFWSDEGLPGIHARGCTPDQRSRGAQASQDLSVHSPQLRNSVEIHITGEQTRCVIHTGRPSGNRTDDQPTLSSTSTTSAPRHVNRGSIAGENRENVSAIVSTRGIRPANCLWAKPSASLVCLRGGLAILMKVCLDPPFTCCALATHLAIWPVDPLRVEAICASVNFDLFTVVPRPAARTTLAATGIFQQ
jgi:hypothetical protein